MRLPIWLLAVFCAGLMLYYLTTLVNVTPQAVLAGISRWSWGEWLGATATAGLFIWFVVLAENHDRVYEERRQRRLAMDRHTMDT